MVARKFLLELMYDFDSANGMLLRDSGSTKGTLFVCLRWRRSNVGFTGSSVVEGRLKDGRSFMEMLEDWKGFTRYRGFEERSGSHRRVRVGKPGSFGSDTAVAMHVGSNYVGTRFWGKRVDTLWDLNH